jgi:hypothetical protein
LDLGNSISSCRRHDRVIGHLVLMGVGHRGPVLPHWSSERSRFDAWGWLEKGSAALETGAYDAGIATPMNISPCSNLRGWSLYRCAPNCVSLFAQRHAACWSCRTPVYPTGFLFSAHHAGCVIITARPWTGSRRWPF